MSGPTTELVTSPVQQLVLQVLADGTDWSISALADELGKHRREVLAAVRELSGRGLIRRAQYGWTLPKTRSRRPSAGEHVDAVRKLRAVEDLLTVPFVGAGGRYFVAYDELRAILHPAEVRHG